MNKISRMILCAAMAIMIIFSSAVVSEAKFTNRIYFSTGMPKEGIVYDKNGNMYIYMYGKRQYGWVEYRYNMYYAYKTSRYGVPKGSLAVDVYRKHKGKIYYFGIDGKMLTHDTKYIKLDKKRFNVRYIYTPGDPTRRYSVNDSHFQKYINKKWVNIGKRCFPHWMIDNQM